MAAGPAGMHPDAAMATLTGVCRGVLHLADDDRKRLRVRFVSAGDELERLGHYQAAWHLLAEAPLLLSQPQGHPPEWRGEDLTGRHLLVQRRIRHLGAELRMARFAARVAALGAGVTLRVEPRLTALFARTFPESVVEAHPGDTAARFDFAASYERLAFHVGRDGAEIAAAYRPLRPDPGRVAAFRRRHAAGDTTVIGVSWWSRNSRKTLPSLADWARVIAGQPHRWVSLQYDEEACGRSTLAAAAGREVLGAPDLDQLLDIDDFAAQVAAVDAVLTISNTTAHMAGMLAKPCVVVLDDQPQLSWPVHDRASPFYPTVSLVRAQQRPFPAVLDEAVALLNAKLSGVMPPEAAGP